MHTTLMAVESEFNVIEYDETLNDYIWVRIYWWLFTRDIDLVNDNGSRELATLHYTDLPYPNIAAGNFIPFEEVNERDILRWVHEAEGTKEILRKQQDNLVLFLRKYGLEDQWRGNI